MSYAIIGFGQIGHALGRYWRAIGRAESMMEKAAALGLRWLKGIGTRDNFPIQRSEQIWDRSSSRASLTPMVFSLDARLPEKRHATGWYSSIHFFYRPQEFDLPIPTGEPLLLERFTLSVSRSLSSRSLS
jgi:hypothetical protein